MFDAGKAGPSPSAAERPESATAAPSSRTSPAAPALPGTLMPESWNGADPEPTPGLTGAVYGMLFLLGLVLGVIGGFTHQWYLGEVPAGAVVWIPVLFAVPYVMGRLMGGRMGAAVPAAGWLIMSFMLAMPQPAGDLAIADNSAGYCYLYGGMTAVLIAVVSIPSNGSWLMRTYRKT